ncbi:hypothetical protein [Saccharopolyspora sp. 5N708]|uniref:hypothetical protein n=1 Tax=Saccharopolyspora sp. 5N708 TaxID=3457424 RepID=UPI003FD070B6
MGKTSTGRPDLELPNLRAFLDDAVHHHGTVAIRGNPGQSGSRTIHFGPAEDSTD